MKPVIKKYLSYLYVVFYALIDRSYEFVNMFFKMIITVVVLLFLDDRGIELINLYSWLKILIFFWLIYPLFKDLLEFILNQLDKKKEKKH